MLAHLETFRQMLERQNLSQSNVHALILSSQTQMSGFSPLQFNNAAAQPFPVEQPNLVPTDLENPNEPDEELERPEGAEALAGELSKRDIAQYKAECFTWLQVPEIPPTPQLLTK